MVTFCLSDCLTFDQKSRLAKSLQELQGTYEKGKLLSCHILMLTVQ
jgi:hypothetical protein